MASRNNRHINNGWNIQGEIIAVLLLALGIFLSLSLFSFNIKDPGINAAADTNEIHNWAGLIGAYTSDLFITTFGLISFIAPPLALLLAGLQFAQRQVRLKWRASIGCLFLLISGAALIHLKWPFIAFETKSIPGGGIIGGIFGELLLRYLNRPGAYLLALTIAFISFSLASGLSPIVILKIMAKAIGQTVRFIAKKAPIAADILWDYTLIAVEYIKEVIANLRKPKETNEEILAEISPPPKIETKPEAEGPRAEKTAQQPKIIKPAQMKKVSSDEQLAFARISSGRYNPPPLSLLDTNENNKQAMQSNEALQKNSIIVAKKLADFDVAGNVTAIHPGPVITMYEFEPAAGTKVSKISNLEDDLSLTLGGKNVRIVPHLPGKAAVGIEVPNSQRDSVGLKEILTSAAFQRTSAKLPIALGVTADGHPMVTDLAKMPHLLIAGATGSGKSVAINCIICGLLYKLPPDQMKLILVDPKMLELSTYQGIPHLLLPVVTRPRLAVRALRWAVKEMEKRYRLMADAGARNLPTYNEIITSGKVKIVSQEEANQMIEQNPEAVAHTGTIPYLVVVVDEMADLMMTASQDMEDLVIRLAQMARAAGIHLILATQRPSVDVITGLIKANFPARIAFKVSARHDSRTILDSNGAETLLGSGDMLYMTPTGNNLLRLHGAYISEPEVSRVVSHLQEQGTPSYDQSIISATEEQAEENPEEENTEEDNKLYDDAVKIVAQSRQASISMIQRKLRIGYNRAARLIERMEVQGVVGPADGSKPREVLINQL